MLTPGNAYEQFDGDAAEGDGPSADNNGGGTEPRAAAVTPDVLGKAAAKLAGQDPSALLVEGHGQPLSPDAELLRLRKQNRDLQSEVDRLRGLQGQNRELQQVVHQLKRVVASYGFSELEVMNVKPKRDQEGIEQLRYAPRELFMIISMKFAEIAAYYGTAYVYTNYLTEELGCSDQEAGNLYAAYGFITTFLGVGAGIVIDKLGVRRSLLIGTIASSIARFGTGITGSKWTAGFISVTFYPLGAAFGVPVLALGIRRYSHRDNRKFAFSIFYTMLMLATLLGTMMINQIRGFFPQGMLLWGWELSWMRVTWMVCTLFTLYTVVVAAFLRDIQVLDEHPLEDMAVEKVKLLDDNGIEVLKQIVKTDRFRRLALVSLVFCGVQMGFRHLDATFPKYMMRTYGPHAPWEMILTVNPIVTFFAAPLCTAMLIKYKVGFRKALILGAFLTGFSTFFICVFESYLGAILWILVMSLGQAIWGPKLYEYSTMSAPAGREGLFVAITASPIYLSSVPTGVVSGWLLSHYCAKGSTAAQRNGQLLWFWVALSVCTSPILLWIFRKTLLKRGDDKPPEQVQDQKFQLDCGDSILDEAQLQARSTSISSDVMMGFGNVGAAWAGMELDPGHRTDSDEEFEESHADTSPTKRAGDVATESQLQQAPESRA